MSDKPTATAKPTIGSSEKPPILLVPGAFSGAWFYQDNLAPYFAEQGYQVFTFSFESQQRQRAQLSGLALNDYKKALAAEIAEISEQHSAPIVIAHSMGALVLMSLLPSLKLPAAVLLTPALPEGLLAHPKFYWGQSKISLAKFAAFMLYPPVRFWTPKPPGGLFSKRVSTDVVEAVNSQLAAESLLAIGSMAVGINIDLSAIETPCLLVSAGQDGIVPPAGVNALAEKLQADLLEYPDMAHLLTFEPDWEDMASDTVNWCNAIHKR